MTTHIPMTAARQPFAPLNEARLQNLTSIKNRQNALPTALTSPTKRKATTYEDDLHSYDSENIDPTMFLTSNKKSKAPDGSSKDTTFLKPINYFLTKAPPSPNDPSSCSSFKPITSTPTTASRPTLQPRSQAPKLTTSNLSKSTPLSVPAGRSSTRKRAGILNNRRKTSSPYTRIDPPNFSTPISSGLGFSIDAALSGTTSNSYRPSHRTKTSTSSSNKDAVYEVPTKPSWFFEIHEDTAEELATNLMEHSTCTLEISSDEESAARLKDERGKENIPPLDDISQTRRSVPLSSGGSSKSRLRKEKIVDNGGIDIDRSPLGEMLAKDFWPEGCDGNEVVIVPGDVDAVEEASKGMTFDFQAQVRGMEKVKEEEEKEKVKRLMMKCDKEIAAPAALLQPLEKAEEGWEVWEC